MITIYTICNKFKPFFIVYTNYNNPLSSLNYTYRYINDLIYKESFFDYDIV